MSEIGPERAREQDIPMSAVVPLEFREGHDKHLGRTRTRRTHTHCVQ